MVITIDGLGVNGKSTLAKRISMDSFDIITQFLLSLSYKDIVLPIVDKVKHFYKNF